MSESKGKPEESGKLTGKGEPATKKAVHVKVVQKGTAKAKIAVPLQGSKGKPIKWGEKKNAKSVGGKFKAKPAPSKAGSSKLNTDKKAAAKKAASLRILSHDAKVKARLRALPREKGYTPDEPPPPRPRK